MYEDSTNFMQSFHLCCDKILLGNDTKWKQKRDILWFVPLRVSDNLKEEILENFNSLLAMKKQGNNLFFTDIDKIKKIMLDELN